MPDIKCAYCGIKIVPAELDFEVQDDWPNSPGIQWFHVKRQDPGEVFPRWNATVDADWVKLNPSHSDKEETVIVNVQSVGKPAGVYEAKVTFSSAEANNTPVFAMVKLTVKAKPVPLKIITTSLPDGGVGQAYEFQIVAEGGVPPYIWACAGLPDGLIIDAQTGQITGTPISSGFFPVKARVQDSEIPAVGYTDDYAINIPEPPMPPVKVAITSPVGGEVFYEGDTEDINWVAENAGDEILDIHLILDGVAWIIATNLPIKSLGYLWTIAGIPVSENAVIALLTNYQTIQCPPFAIRERSGCLPWPLAKALKKLRKLAMQYWETYHWIS